MHMKLYQEVPTYQSCHGAAVTPPDQSPEPTDAHHASSLITISVSVLVTKPYHLVTLSLLGITPATQPYKLV